MAIATALTIGRSVSTILLTVRVLTEKDVVLGLVLLRPIHDSSHALHETRLPAAKQRSLTLTIQDHRHLVVLTTRLENLEDCFAVTWILPENLP